MICICKGGRPREVGEDEWAEEQKRLDREWYGMDEGYDESHNPFADTSDEYTKRKEEELEKKKKKRMSAQQRQINKVYRTFNYASCIFVQCQCRICLKIVCSVKVEGLSCICIM